MKQRPNPQVEAWLAGQAATECFISAVTEAELRFGIEILPAGQRRLQLQAALTEMFDKDFAGRVLPFDSAAAVAYATIAANRRTAGRPISQMDAQIAAIA
jgi:predicted nucleic acid-binding protein